MSKKNYDLIVIGGGTAGCATSYIAAKNGLNVLLLEKTSQLGGSMTGGLVVPVMNCGNNQVNTAFYNKLIEKSKTIGAQITYQGNSGWFNPELLKIILDVMMDEVGVDVIFLLFRCLFLLIRRSARHRRHLHRLSAVCAERRAFN